MQDQEFAQQFEQIIEIDDMEMELEPQIQDFDLMPSTQQVTNQSPTLSAAKSSLGEEGEIIPLGDDLVMDMYNFSYDELHNNIVKLACQEIFLDDLTSLPFMGERINVSKTRRDPEAISSYNFSFVGVANLNTQCLMVENKKLAKNLQAVRKNVEQLF